MLSTAAVINSMTVADTTASGSKPLRILAFGDSLTEGMCRECAEFHPYSIKLQELLDGEGVAAQVVQKGISGERVVPQMTQRLPEILRTASAAGLKFHWVLILGGINDLGSGTSAGTVFQGLQSLYAACRDHGAHVLAMTALETGVREGPFEDSRRALNRLIRVLAVPRGAGSGRGRGRDQDEEDVGPGVVLLDLEREVPLHSLSDAERQHLWAPEHVALHLTAAGYDRMGASIFKALLPHLRGTAAAATFPSKGST